MWKFLNSPGRKNCLKNYIKVYSAGRNGRKPAKFQNFQFFYLTTGGLQWPRMTSNDLVTHLHAYLQKYKPQIIIDLNEIKAITIGAKIIIITLRGHPTLNPRSPSIFLGSIYPRTTLKLYHWVGFRNRCLLGIQPTLDGMLLRFLFAATVFHTKERRFIQ